MIRRLVQQIRELIRKVRWRRRRIASESRRVAPALGVPAEVVSRIMDQLNAELRELSATDEAGDARHIITKAANELSKFQDDAHSQLRDAVITRFLDELPAREYSILSYRTQGLRTHKIAELMETDVESVRHSLAQIYARFNKTSGLCSGPGEFRTAGEQRMARRAGR